MRRACSVCFPGASPSHHRRVSDRSGEIGGDADVCGYSIGDHAGRDEPVTEGDIASYVGSGEPMDKAGAYAIQGMASRWISRIEGDYFNVVGLPVNLVFRMLREHGSL